MSLAATLGDELRPGGSVSEADAAAAAAVGRERARELVARHGTRDPSSLAAAEGLTVESDEWAGGAGVRLVGTYADGVVTVYDAQVPALAADLDVDTSAARAFVVAHELGHHVVDADALSAVRTAQRSSSRWRRLLRRVVPAASTSPSKSLEERAVHAFATSLVGVDARADAAADAAIGVESERDRCETRPNQTRPPTTPVNRPPNAPTASTTSTSTSND